ncbi:Sigma factor SigB regulation protein RsbQ [compost metagenome]
MPALVLQCSDDIIAPNVVGEYVHRETPGSTYRLMKATGHCPHMSAPDETIALIREFLTADVAV